MAADITHRLPLPTMRWNAWVVAADQAHLSDGIKGLLAAALGISGPPQPSPSAESVRLSDSLLGEADAAAIARVVGAEHISLEPGDRLPRSGGKSTPDLLRRKQERQEAPDAVVIPGNEDEVAAVLAHCGDAGIAVVPFGGGTSVVGGLDPLRGAANAVIALDLRRFDQLVALDEISQLATLQAGLAGPRAEELLGERGYRLGHYPQSFQFATIGGFAAARSSGQASSGHGRFDEMVVGLTVVTPQGELTLGRAQKTAAGPDLRQLFLGSEGVFGVITQVVARVRPKPASVRRQAWRFPDFTSGEAALRAVAQSGFRPTVMRLSDEVETGVSLATTARIGDADSPGGALAVTTFEGPDDETAAFAELTARAFCAAGGNELGPALADSWEAGRFSAPYLRDALLEVGAGCETLETATVWSKVDELKASVTAALPEAFAENGMKAMFMCHISHVYATSASLYFTVVYAMGEDPIAQWAGVKQAVSQAISDSGATISHHGVGADHRPWLAEEDGGDGTMAQALPLAADRGMPIGLIPSGTGNDLSRVLGIPRHDPVAAARIVRAGRTQAFDLGKIVTETDGRETLFDTVVAIGFDALVNERANQMRWPKGKLRYVIATLAELANVTARRLRFEVDGEVFERDVALAAIGNTSSYGGGMRICPEADPSDGLLELTVVEHSSHSRLLRFFPTVFAGSHVRLPEVSTYRGASISVRCVDAKGQQPLVCADGERVGTLPCAVTVRPGALRFLVP